MTVAVEGIERHVADHPEIGKSPLDGAHGTAHQVIRIGRFAGVGRLQFGSDRGEQGDGRNAEIARFADGVDQSVERITDDAGHRADRHALTVAFGDENRPDQVVGGEPAFRHQAPRPRVTTVAAKAGLGKTPRRKRSKHLLCGLQSLQQIGENIVDVFDADRKANIPFGDAGRQLVFDGKLRMGGARRVNGQATGIADIGDVIEHPEGVDEALAGIDAAPQLESDGQRHHHAHCMVL